MNRRSFLKALVAAGVVVAVGLPLFDETIPNLKDYPGLRYEKEYLLDKMAHLHIVHFDVGNTKWYIAELTHEAELHPELLKIMIDKSIEAGYING